MTCIECARWAQRIWKFGVCEDCLRASGIDPNSETPVREMLPPSRMGESRILKESYLRLWERRAP